MNGRVILQTLKCQRRRIIEIEIAAPISEINNIVLHVMMSLFSQVQYPLKPCSPGGSVMIQKTAISSPITGFQGLMNKTSYQSN